MTITEDTSQILNSPYQISGRQLARIIGLLSATLPVVLPAPLTLLTPTTGEESAGVVWRLQELQPSDKGSPNRATDSSQGEWEGDKATPPRLDDLY